MSSSSLIRLVKDVNIPEDVVLVRGVEPYLLVLPNGGDGVVV